MLVVCRHLIVLMRQIYIYIYICEVAVQAGSRVTYLAISNADEITTTDNMSFSTASQHTFVEICIIFFSMVNGIVNFAENSPSSGCTSNLDRE